jgi:endonuclease/exonuclease/phosphatase family metal-dependent hydrolase
MPREIILLVLGNRGFHIGFVMPVKKYSVAIWQANTLSQPENIDQAHESKKITFIIIAQKTMRFLAWNIDQARREEAFPQTAWDTRSPGVKALIQRTEADVIALVELRDLETSKESARAFLSSPQFEEYDVVHRRYCCNKIAFSMALLVKSSLYLVGDVRVHSFMDVPDNDKIVMFVDLKEKASLRPFTVGVTHFGMQESEKWTSVHILRHLMLNQRYPCFVYGDYNFFDDMEGIDMRHFMLDKCRDLAFPLTNANGTFVGFPHDENKQSWEKPSRLDHVFCANPTVKVRAACSPEVEKYQFDNSSYATYTYPSDHLALMLDLALE